MATAPAPPYNPLGYNPSFRYFGRSWDASQQAAFERELRRRGLNVGQFRRNHPGAYNTFDPVESEIYSVYNPQLQALHRLQQERQDYYSRLIHDYGGFYGALGPLLGGIAPAIGGAYREGAETMKAGGEGYGAVLNNTDAAAADAANKVLGSIGAPEGQKISGGDAGGVLAGLAGWLPSEMMNAQGGAYAAAASQLPKTASLEAQLQVRDIIRNAMDEDKDFAGREQDILSGLPGDRMKLRDQRQAQGLALRKQKQAELKAERDYWMKQQYLYLSQGRYQLAQQAAARADAAAKRSQMNDQGLDVNGNPKVGYHTDPKTGDVVKDGWHIDPKTGVPAKNGKAGSGQKPADWGRVQKDMASEDLTVESSSPYGGKTKKPMTYKQAYTYLWNKYSGLVQNKGRLRKLINQILAGKGIKKKATRPRGDGTLGQPPGTMGHPLPPNMGEGNPYQQ